MFFVGGRGDAGCCVCAVAQPSHNQGLLINTNWLECPFSLWVCQSHRDQPWDRPWLPHTAWLRPWLGMGAVPEHWALWMELPGWFSVSPLHSFCYFIHEYLRANLSGKNYFLFNLNLIHSTLWLIWLSGILWLWTAFYFQMGGGKKGFKIGLLMFVFPLIADSVLTLSKYYSVVLFNFSPCRLST